MSPVKRRPRPAEPVRAVETHRPTVAFRSGFARTRPVPARRGPDRGRVRDEGGASLSDPARCRRAAAGVRARPADRRTAARSRPDPLPAAAPVHRRLRHTDPGPPREPRPDPAAVRRARDLHDADRRRRRQRDHSGARAGGRNRARGDHLPDGRPRRDHDHSPAPGAAATDHDPRGREPPQRRRGARHVSRGGRRRGLRDRNGRAERPPAEVRRRGGRRRGPRRRGRVRVRLHLPAARESTGRDRAVARHPVRRVPAGGEPPALGRPVGRDRRAHPRSGVRPDLLARDAGAGPRDVADADAHPQRFCVHPRRTAVARRHRRPAERRPGDLGRRDHQRDCRARAVRVDRTDERADHCPEPAAAPGPGREAHPRARRCTDDRELGGFARRRVTCRRARPAARVPAADRPGCCS